jgi:uncharacterized protein YjbJ (UPF0337 family)
LSEISAGKSSHAGRCALSGNPASVAGSTIREHRRPSLKGTSLPARGCTDTRHTPVLMREDGTMDKDRVEGSGKKLKGEVKEQTGKVLGDEKLKAEGKADKAEGKIQNAAGGVKDAVKKKK